MGKMAFLKPNTSTHIVGPNITNAIVVKRPIIPP